jgi:hypothetical protein
MTAVEIEAGMIALSAEELALLAGKVRREVENDEEVSMKEYIWTVPSHRMDAATAGRTILIQHQRIRVLLVHAQEVAERALDQQAQPPDAVASAIGDIYATLEIHLRFEEKVLVDIFNDDLPLGPMRAKRLRDEHARQRVTLAGSTRRPRPGRWSPCWRPSWRSWRAGCSTTWRRRSERCSLQTPYATTSFPSTRATGSVEVVMRRLHRTE